MDKDAMITYLIGELKKENLELHDLIIPEELEEKQKLLRALFNTRKPMAASTQFLTIQDLYLQVRKGERGFVQLSSLQPIPQDDRIYLWKGDITRLEVDAIVNEEPVGMAKITPAYNLPSAFVIHTVGPKIVDQPTQIDEDLLAKSYLSVLALAEKNNIESIAIPCLSTGDFNFPKQKAAKIAIQTVKTFIDESSIIKKVIFNVFDDENLAIYQKLLAE